MGFSEIISESHTIIFKILLGLGVGGGPVGCKVFKASGGLEVTMRIKGDIRTLLLALAVLTSPRTELD